MADRFRAAVDAEDLEFKAYARHLEHHVGDDTRRRAVIFAIATMAYPDRGWQVTLVQVEGKPDEWILLEDPPGFGDKKRTYLIASGASDHEVDDVPKAIAVRHGVDGQETTRVPVAPWD
jgi:hypothetical protein